MMKTIPDNSILIYTDGASSGNPGPGGWGTLIVDTRTEKVYELGEPLKRTTNNETELLALLEGLRKLSELSLTKDVHIYVYLDSEYVRNGVTKWMKGWKQKGWVTSTGEAVKNKEIWMAIGEELEMLKKIIIEYIHVDGHAGILGNERVNDIAQGYAQGITVDLYAGTLAKYSLTVDQLFLDPHGAGVKSAAKKFSGATKGGWYLSIVDGVLEKHLTWAACEMRVKGTKAVFKKVTSVEEENTWIKKYL